jgi:ribonuclease Z
MTTRLTAELAREAGVGQLLLFHLSSRYAPDIWSEMLREAQAIFPRTGFPSHWRLEKGRGVPPGTVFPNISAIVEAV